MSQARPRLCAVIVLYCQAPGESRAIRSFAQSLSNAPELASDLFVCVYDNSPHPARLPQHLFACEWTAFQPQRNDGLARAYNAALDVARQNRMEWLLLLDADTDVTASFLKTCIETIPTVESDVAIGAIVPHIEEGGVIHSPRFASAFRRRPVDRRISGAVREEVVALNSGSVLRVSAVDALGGFNPDFWLDYLDYWVFRSLYDRGYRVFVLPETLSHSLSFADATRRMSRERYENMLAAEHYFTTRFGSRWERVRLKLVLLKRAVLFGIRDHNTRFARLTILELFASAVRQNRRN